MINGRGRHRSSERVSNITHVVEVFKAQECLCGREIQLLTSAEQWMYFDNLDEGDINKFDWCKMCTEDPRFQMLLLAVTEL